VDASESFLESSSQVEVSRLEVRGLKLSLGGRVILDKVYTSDDRGQSWVHRADVPIVRCELVTGWESRYYMRRTPITVMEVEVATPGVVTSRYSWAR